MDSLLNMIPNLNKEVDVTGLTGNTSASAGLSAFTVTVSATMSHHTNAFEPTSPGGVGTALTRSAFGPRLVVRANIPQVDISVVSARLQRELFFARFSGVQVVAKHVFGFDIALNLESFRLDSQARSAMQAKFGAGAPPPSAKLLQHSLRKGAMRAYGAAARSSRHQFNTPAVLATVGTADTLLPGVEDESSGPCFQLACERLALHGQSELMARRIHLASKQRWEIVVDHQAAKDLLELFSEFAEAASDSSRKQSWEAREEFCDLLASASSDFTQECKPNAPTPVIKLETLEISGLELGLWGSVEMSKLPTSKLPASLVFVLRFLCFSDTLFVDGSTMLVKQWDQSEIRWSVTYLLAVVRMKYEGTVLLFLAKAFSASNFLLLPRMLINPMLMSRCVLSGAAELINAVDLAPLSLDSEYIEAKKQQHPEVASLTEGVQQAGEHLLGGFFGVTDCVVKPSKRFREEGIAGVPEGVVKGLASAFVKPLDGICRALYALLMGMAAACAGNILKKRRRASPSASRTDTLDIGPPPGTVSDPLSGYAANAQTRPKGPLEAEPEKAAGGLSSGPSASGTSNRVPALQGQTCMRRPRLLFGERATMAAYVGWQSDLFSVCHGPVLNAWHLSGGSDADFHLVLVAMESGLWLYNLHALKDPPGENLGFLRRSVVGALRKQTATTRHPLAVREAKRKYDAALQSRWDTSTSVGSANACLSRNNHSPNAPSISLKSISPASPKSRAISHQSPKRSRMPRLSAEAAGPGALRPQDTFLRVSSVGTMHDDEFRAGVDPRVPFACICCPRRCRRIASMVNIYGITYLWRDPHGSGDEGPELARWCWSELLSVRIEREGGLATPRHLKTSWSRKLKRSVSSFTNSQSRSLDMGSASSDLESATQGWALKVETTGQPCSEWPLGVVIEEDAPARLRRVQGEVQRLVGALQA